METWLIGIIIFALNVAVSLLIRYMDRGSNSLEKVRKYADKVKSDFNDFVTNRTSDLQNVATELEVAKREGKVLLNRFNTLSTDFVSKAQGLEARMQTIRELEGHIAKSEDSMQKLLNLAEHADKNIEQIRKESNFVDSLAKKINSAHNELEQLNSSIPEMQKHFNDIAHEELENYKAKILNDVESQIHAIEDRLSLSQDEANHLLEQTSKQLQEIYASTFEDARNKSHSLEGEAFANLQKLAEQRMVESRTLFNENLSSLQNELKEKLDAVVREAEAFKKEYITKINDYGTTMTNELSNTEIALNENITQIKLDSEQFNNEMRQNMAKNIQSTKDEINSFSSNILKDVEGIKSQTNITMTEAQNELETFKSEWRGELANYKASLGGDFSNLELLLKGRVEEIKNSEKQSNFELKEYIDTNNLALKNEFERVSSSIKGDIEKDRAYIDEFKQNWEIQTSSFIEKIKKDFEETETEINNKSSLLIQKMNEAERALQATASYLESEFKNGEKNKNEQLKSMLITLQGNIDELSTEAENKIADFKVQIETRFKKFEELVSGTDVMQDELEKAISNTQEKIKEDFNQHVAILKLEQQTFFKNFDAQTQQLTLRLNDIDSNVESLKNKAIENVSDKLSVFEKDFINSLSKRKDEMSNNFEALKADVKERLQLLLSEKEAERREIEDIYKSQLKERVLKLEEDYQGQFSILEQKVQDIENNLTRRVSASDDSIAKHAQDLKDEINVALDKARQYLDKELADYKVKLQDSLSTQYFELEGAAKDMKDKIENANNNAVIEVEAVKNNFNGWKAGIEQKFDSSRSMFEDKLSRIESTTSDAMEGLKAKYDGQYNELIVKNNELFEGIKERVASIDDQLMIAQSQFKKDADSLSDMVDERVKDAFSSIDKKVVEANANTEEEAQNIRSLIHTLRENLNEIQERTTVKIQNEAERLNSMIEEINEKQNAFISQTQIFEKVDQLKLDLEKSIEKLKAEVTHFDVYRTAMDEITNQYNRVCKLESEIEEKITSIMNERSRIERVEGQFARLEDVSNSIDRKIDTLKNIGDDIQSYEVQVRKVEESIDKVNARYERLEKKEVVLDQTAESIGVAFEELKTLENEIRSFKSEISGMPAEIEGLRSSMQALTFNKDKADSVFATLRSLDDMLSSMEEKMGHLQDSRSWLASVETRLTDLSNRTDEKLKLLATLYKGEPSQRNAGGAPAISARENVISLHRQGWKVDEIASVLKLSRGEVDLIIEHSDRIL